MLEDYFLILLGHLTLHRFVLCLFIDWNYHNEGYGKMLMEYWESDMKSQAYNNVVIKKDNGVYSRHHCLFCLDKMNEIEQVPFYPRCP